MNILCTICSDIVNQSESIYVTKCGHLFHHHCLSQWILRSKSCPQCRNKVTDKCMFRIFPTFSSDTTLDDATTIQSRLDDAQLQLRQNRISQKELQEKLNSATEQYMKCLEVLKSTEAKLMGKELAVAALKEQKDFLSKEVTNVQKLESENETLKKNLTTLKGLQEVLNATAADVESLLAAYSDLTTLAAFAASLKRALCESENMKKQYRSQMQEARGQARREAELHNVSRRYISDLEADKASLEKKLHDLELKLLLPAEQHSPKPNTSISEEANTSVSDVMENAFIVEDKCALPSRFRRVQRASSDQDISTPKLLRALVGAYESADSSVPSRSPYLTLKQSCLALSALRQRGPRDLPGSKLSTNENTPSNSQSNPLSIFHKKQSQDEPAAKRYAVGTAYDGFGGHARLDPYEPRAPAHTAPPGAAAPLGARSTSLLRLTARHRLKRPAAPPSNNHTIDNLLEKLHEKNIQS